jgi:DNA-binding response OmpR family regulator
MKTILIVDNDQDFLDTFAENLSIRGFDAFKAKTMEKARQIMRTDFIQMVVVDIRIEDDDDEKDTWGIKLIQEAEFKSIPKIVLTNFPFIETVKEALKPTSAGYIPAIDYIDKIHGMRSNLDEICRLFDQHVCHSQDILFNWEISSMLSFPGLAGQLNKNLSVEKLSSHIHELIYLFQTLFAGSLEVNITRTPWFQPGKIALSIHAIQSTREDYYVLTCGEPEKIEAEQINAALYSPDPESKTRTRYIRSYRTTHYGANLWKLVEAPQTNMQSFLEFFQNKPEKLVKAAIKNIYENTLEEWRRIKPARLEPADLERWQREMLPMHSFPEIEVLNLRIQRIAEESIARRCIINFEQNRNHFRITFTDHHKEDFPNPLQYLYGDQELPVKSVLVQNAPGRIDFDTIQVDQLGNAWLTDFADAGEYTTWHPFTFLEASLRFRLLDASHLFPIYQLEKQLLLKKGLSSFSQTLDTDPEAKKTVAAIQSIRSLAGQMTGNDPLPYAVSLFFICATEILATSFDMQLKKNYSQLMHRLLLMGMLASCFQQAAPVNHTLPSGFPQLKVKINERMVFRGEDEISFTDTEFRILAYLYQNLEILCSRESILENVFEIAHPTTEQKNNYINVNINRMREKLEMDPKNPKYLINVHGRGLKLVLNP